MKTESVARTLPFLLACAVVVAPVRAAVAAPEPMRATPSAPLPAKEPAAASLSRGKVLETMEGAGYTYVRVEAAGAERWLAGPQTRLAVGDTVEWPEGMEMKGFASKALGRTFDSIVFVDSLRVTGGASDAAAPHASLSGKADEGPEVSGIEKAAGGLTVAEVYDRKAALGGKEVVVRGKVVKFTGGVMGRNWLHLRDGSRSAAGENDLTVTSDAAAAVGDVVTVRGTLALDRDFGFGYRYDAIVEKASVAKE